MMSTARYSVVTAVVCAVAILSALSAGCATGEGAAMADGTKSDERRVPVEVTDHTIDERSDSARSTRARVSVRIDDVGRMGGDLSTQEETVRQAAVRCYQDGLSGDAPESQGAVVYEIIVTRNGQVAGTEVMSTALHREEISSCVEHVLSRLRFEIESRNRPLYRLHVRLDFFLETLVPDEPPV